MNWALIALMFIPPLLPFIWMIKKVLTKPSYFGFDGSPLQILALVCIFLIFSPIIYLLMVGAWSAPIYWLAIIFGAQILPGV